MNNISVVVPMLNEESIVDEFVNKVKIELENMELDFEIILIDDGSKDQTWRKIEENAKLDKRVRGLKFSRNFGQHNSITAGLNYSQGDRVIVMDGDLQDRPEIFSKLIERADQGFDIVFVSRMRRPESFLYLLAQRTYYKILNFMTGIELDPRQANFSIISREVVNAFIELSEDKKFYPIMIKWLGFTRSEVAAKHGVRFSGKPSYSFGRRLKLAIDVIISFSNRPLTAIFTLGILLNVLTFTLLTSTAFVFGFQRINFQLVTLVYLGILLNILGILGLYLGRIFNETKNRPSYIISDSIGFPKEKQK
jgi:glycosyltransferase involved in cell wall biosynthesis